MGALVAQMRHYGRVSAGDGQWERVDEHLYRGERIQAIKATGEDLGLSLRESLEAVHARWTTLKTTAPGRFQVSLDGYWDGVYS
jgi:hypothetical protein